MKCDRCSGCDINYPATTKVCRVCGKDTWRLTGTSWDTDWQNKVRILQSQWVIGQPLPNVDAIVYEVKGHLFISDSMLRHYGYLNVDTDSIVLIQNRYFEVNGRVKGEDDNGWWIKEVKPEEEFKQLKIKTLSAHDYSTLQQKRLRT